jgi:hypothetical protein
MWWHSIYSEVALVRGVRIMDRSDGLIVVVLDHSNFEKKLVYLTDHSNHSSNMIRKPKSIKNDLFVGGVC